MGTYHSFTSHSPKEKNSCTSTTHATEKHTHPHTDETLHKTFVTSPVYQFVIKELDLTQITAVQVFQGNIEQVGASHPTTAITHKHNFVRKL